MTHSRDRKLRRLFDRLARDGDHCHGCRRDYRDRDTSTVGNDAKGRARMVGECCADRLVSILAVSVYFAAEPPPPWAADDRDWFVARPDRAHRLRDAYPGEWPPSQGMEHTVVRQQQPGARLRLGLTVLPHLLALGEPPEAALWAIFDLVSEAYKRGERGVTVAEIMKVWTVREVAARA